MANQGNVADQEKAKGNEYFGKKEYFKAAAHYTKAIKADPKNHVLYSNRSAAFMKMDPPKDVKALNDADQIIKMKPDWAKGHYRRAQALISLKRFDEALATMAECSRLDESLKKEVNQLTKSVHKMQSQQIRDSMELLLSKERFPAEVGEGLDLVYSDERCASFRDQVLNAVKLAAASGSTAVKQLNGAFVVLPGKLSHKGHPENFERVTFDQALLSPEKQKHISTKIAEEFTRKPTHAAAFIASKASLLAPRKWEHLPDSLPAKSDGIFVQFQSPSVNEILFLPKSDSPEEEEFVTIEDDFKILGPLYRQSTKGN